MVQGQALTSFVTTTLTMRLGQHCKRPQCTRATQPDLSPSPKRRAGMPTYAPFAGQGRLMGSWKGAEFSDTSAPRLKFAAR